jgi:hypothetical protein
LDHCHAPKRTPRGENTVGSLLWKIECNFKESEHAYQKSFERLVAHRVTSAKLSLSDLLTELE